MRRRRFRNARTSIMSVTKIALPLLLLALALGIGPRADGQRYYRPRMGAPGDAAAAPNPTAAANSDTVGVVSGGVDGTYVRIAADLAAVLDSDHLRILPIIGKGSVQNISDILYLRGVDIGIVQSDALAYAERQNLYPNVDQQVEYIAKLYEEEVHILARKDIAQLSDLAHQKVNVDVVGSGTAMTASVLFGSLNIPIDTVNDDQNAALEKLKRGDIAAMVYVVGKPARLFTPLAAGSGLHFLAVPISQELLDTYLPATLQSSDYPGLVPTGGTVDTVAVGAVMAVYNWPAGTTRYRNVARFVDAFFSNFSQFQQPARHPKWREINLAAQVPGWTRFPAAQDWLQRAAMAGTAGGAVQAEFSAFLQSGGGSVLNLSDTQKAALFRQFLQWESSRPAVH
jgi:uncharacterized protein